MLKNAVNKALSCTAIVAIVGFSAMAHDQAQVQKQATPVTPLGSAKLHHVAISVTNFQQTVRWYQDKLGFRATFRRDLPQLSTQQAFLELNGIRLEVFARQSSRRGQPAVTNVPDDLLIQGYKHLAIVVNDLDIVAAELRRKGVKFLWEPRVDEALKLKLCFIQDNNGNLIELVEELKQAN
jgi:catechol 2,3-dioxygenase-like lactoylglutathione lyase family enzyme